MAPIHVVLGVFSLGCGQSDQTPPMLEATPTPTEKITEMDFESGEVEEPAEVTDDFRCQAQRFNDFRV